MTPQLIGAFVGAYLLGSIPFAVIITRYYGIDIFRVSSGNPGATNVARALGWKKAWPVLVLDIAKGLLPALFGRFVLHAGQEWCLALGLAAVIGHCLSPFLKFKGGKGIATTLGAVLGAAPIVALGGFGVFLLIFLATRYISLASMAGVATTVVLGAFVPGESRWLVPAYALLLVWIVFRHKANVMRLLKGEEPKFYFSKKGTAEAPPAPSHSVNTPKAEAE